MFKRMIRNNLRRPLYSAAVLLFAMVMTVVLCYLHKAGEDELRSYEQTYASVPVTFRVTDLDGSKPDVIYGWLVDLFRGGGLHPHLESFVGQLHVRVSEDGSYTYTTTDKNGLPEERSGEVEVAGIGSFYVAEELTENWGGEVHWFEGFDESILAKEEWVCLVPESKKDVKQMEMTFSYTFSSSLVIQETQTRTIKKTLTVVGYYIDKGNSRFYCPYPTMEQIYAELGKSKEIEELCAVLNDNNRLPELRETAAYWFAEPNPSGEKTPWGRYTYEYYLYALDIDDYMLRSLESNMKSSMQLNQLASVAVFFLSAGAGFLTGFLVIRSKKREIALMRTMGASHPAIFLELALEQLLCIAAGIFLGGAFFLWQPLRKLALFGGIYCIGLSVALVIFLCKNLLTTIKEDE